MPRDSAAADRPASYLVGTAAAFPLFFRDRTKPINQLPFSPSAKFPKSGSSCESRVSQRDRIVTEDQGEVALTSPDQLAVSGILHSGVVVSFQIRGGMTRGTEFLFEIHDTEGDL